VRLSKDWTLAFSEVLLSMKHLAIAFSHGIIENVDDIQYRPRVEAADS
jgi:hypothetical protein